MTIKPIPMTYRGTRFHSTLEADWAAMFDSLGMYWVYEPIAIEIDGDTNYLPDFHLPTQNVWAEVKGPLDERIEKPKILQRAFERDHQDEWAFTCPLVVILRPSEGGSARWQGSLDDQQINIVRCPNCEQFGFMDYTGPWRCRRYCKSVANPFWSEPGGGIWFPEGTPPVGLPFARAPRPARKGR